MSILAAAGAISAILKEVPVFEPKYIKDEEDVKDFLDDANPLDAQKIIGSGEAFLNASEENDFDAVPTSSSEEQKQRLNKEMGLDVASKLGLCDELVTNEDLIEDQNLSAREKNMKKRQKRKQAKERQETSKKMKIAKEIYNVSEDEKENLSNKWWPFEIFVNYLRKDLTSAAWEERHGAATALREIILLHGASGGTCQGLSYQKHQESHQNWLKTLASELLTVLARDRFGDFVSDQVVAPVRETSAMALGNLMKLMETFQLEQVIGVLLELTDQPYWECRHGAYLGLKYLLCAVNLDRDVIVQKIYPRVFQGLKDVVDDVVSEAAAALIPVVKQFVDKINIEELSELLWNCLTDLDDLTGSTQSTMKLLSEVLKIKVPIGITSNLKGLVPRLFAFLHHSSWGVRKAALQTLVSLTSRADLSSHFLPEICGILMSHLYQRTLFEDHQENLDLLEEAWGQICDNCPLGSLLTSTCPLYGHWLMLISRPHLWPLPNDLLIKVRKEDQHFLGGVKAQQTNNENERSNLASRARCTGARLLGKLAGFIARPVPGFDYSKEPSTPLQMFCSKILLANMTKSAFQCTAIGLLIIAWCDHHPDQEKNTLELKLAIWKYLSTEQAEFDEIALSWQQLQTDACDLLATLKYHKILVLENTEVIPDKPNVAEITTLIDYDLENELKRNRIKPSRIDTLVVRHGDIKTRLTKVRNDMKSLAIMTQASLAGALVSLEYLPEKLNPVIRPLMESIKNESLEQLQKISAAKLISFLDLCIKHKMPNPAEKVTRNLIHFAYTDKLNDESIGIMTLKKEEMVEDQTNAIIVRGTKEALKVIARHFKSDVTSKPPKFFERVVLPFQEDHLWRGLTFTELIQFMHAFDIIVTSFDRSLDKELVKTFECFTNLLSHCHSLVRHYSAKCLASLSTFLTNETLTAMMDMVIPNLESTNHLERQGAIESMVCIVDGLGLKFIPYIVLFIVPVLGRMSDPDEQVRQLATSMFANLIKLIPLDGLQKEVDMPKNLLDLKLKQKSFIDELMNLNNVQSITMPVDINAELRSYQVDGIKWLSFLNRYKLHGILCDDMGLGKTLQTICMMATDHFQRLESNQDPCPSLIICPATLCFHWSSEIKKFVQDKSLVPFVYNGSVVQRTPLKKHLTTTNQRKLHNVAVITSYEIVRSDVEMFKKFHWNYLVLDEGHAIRNAKAKTTVAIKSLRAQHRLILSGTPIQNSVLELWSLFDFLMPGFLGSEKQFNARYTKPIVGSRSDGPASKSVSKESKEAGVLALEALHKQVLPFVLRRMKEDVLKDLPPKITQDYYCELSPIQKLLYEDFAKEQKDKKAAASVASADKSGGGGHQHIFQALQYLRKVCNHPKLVLQKSHKHYDLVHQIMQENHTTLNSLVNAAKLPALKQLLLECGIGDDNPNQVVNQHRALVFCQLKSMMDIVENDLLKTMPNLTYLRLDGSVPAIDRHGLVTKFNNDVSIDVLLLTTSVGKFFSEKKVILALINFS